MNNSNEAKAELVKYIFLDIVAFTHNRTIEDQCAVINALNEIVKDAIKSFDIPDDRYMYLPTGDGVCIGLFYWQDQIYDIQIKVALKILKSLREHNKRAYDASKEISLRIGINTNEDNMIIDINGRPNLAGAGINTAQRIMSACDPGNIFVSKSVFETLTQRRIYEGLFNHYKYRIKHGYKIDLYQYLGSHVGLNTDQPSQFRDIRNDEHYVQYVIQGEDIDMKKHGFKEVKDLNCESSKSILNTAELWSLNFAFIPFRSKGIYKVVFKLKKIQDNQNGVINITIIAGEVKRSNKHHLCMLPANEYTYLEEFFDYDGNSEIYIKVEPTNADAKIEGLILFDKVFCEKSSTDRRQ